MPWFIRILTGLLVVFLAIQLVPYGRDHDNPRSLQEPAWNSARTRQLAVVGCFDCHSNLTDWTWYTNVAPISWLTQHDVEDGRKALNFSEWGRRQTADLQAVVEVLRHGDMPPRQYKVLHEEARLSGDERQELEDGLVQTWAASPPAGVKTDQSGATTP